MSGLKVDDIVKGEVTGIESYGIFVKSEDDYSGLVHISEMSDRFVKDVNSYVKIGEEIHVEIKQINEDEKKCILSIKNINYRFDKNKKVRESVRGFYPLKKQLPIWIEEKTEEIKKKNNFKKNQ